MKKTIIEDHLRVLYEGPVSELKKQLEEMALEVPLFEEILVDSSNRLEHIQKHDHSNNNVHTMHEKIYFSNQGILYASRDEWYFPEIKKACKRADKRFLEKNPQYSIDVVKK